MIKKLKVLMVLVSLSLTLGLMSHTYSRYIADATSDIKIQFSKWEIKINNNDITNKKGNEENKITQKLLHGVTNEMEFKKFSKLGSKIITTIEMKQQLDLF